MVLRGATSGGTNAQSTALATSGVIRDVKDSDPNSSLSAHNPSAIELSADQYRSSVLYSPNQTTSEYIIWASNTGKISTVVGDLSDGNDPYLKYGNVSLSFSSDGRTILIFNKDNNSIDSVFGISIRNTITNQTYLLTTNTAPTVTLSNYLADVLVDNAFSSSDLESGILRVKQSVLDSHFSGAFDSESHIFTVTSYFLAPIKFYWSRNDTYQKRFSFDYRVQSWRLIKGSATQNLGVVNLGTKYPLSPKPEGLTVGSFLQGDSANTDKYSMLRVGRLPNSGALPLAENPTGAFNGVLVVADSDINLEYDFSQHTPQPYAIVGEGSADMIFNPSFIIQKAGQTVWYSYLDFVEDSTGRVGDLEKADFTPLFISPIPKAFERPFIKVGNRRYLSPILVENDVALGSLSLSNEREFGLSLSTGQLKFHSDLVGKAQKDSANFDPSYLGAVVYYDGVGLNLQPQPLRNPTALVDNTGTPTSITQGNNGKVYLPLANPYGSNGLGASGVLHQPDGSGVPFNLSVTTDGDSKIGIRENGDSESETASGLVREIIPRTLGMPDLLSMGDTFLFTSGSCISVKPVDKIETENLTKMTGFDFRIKGSVAEITREGIVSLPTGFGSAVKVSSQARKNLGSDEKVYFIQTVLTPSFYTDKAQVISKLSSSFTFDLGDTLVFAVDTVPYKWVATAIAYTTDELITDIITNAEEIATGLTNLASTTLTIKNNFGYLVFECVQEIEIGFGLNGVKDLTGTAKIGLNPGWKATASQDNWLSDSGFSFGLERSPLNKDGSADTPDFYALYRLEDQRVSPKDGLTESSVLFLDYSPLEDIAGYDENVFFRSISFKKVNGIEIPIFSYLKNYEQLIHKFGERYLLFIEDMIMDQSQKIESTTSNLLLGATQMIPQTFLGVEPNPSFGLFVSEDGGALVRKTLGDNFLLDPTSGLGTLINKYGELSIFDFLGTWSANSSTFTNQFATGGFITEGITVGDKLKVLTGDSLGYYIIEEIIDENNLRVSPPFIKENGTYPIAWEIFKGISRDNYDPSLVADISYQQFSHLVNETVMVRLLSWVGVIGGSSNFSLDLGDSLVNEHSISLRYETSGDEISLYRLVVEKLGIIANQSLVISLTPRILLGFFTISVDTTDFSPTLVLDVDWATYVFDPNTVYVNKDTGEVRFGANLLSQYSNADVYYKDNFLPTASILSGTAEFNAFTGDCVISDTDRIANADNSLYFVQQMNTTGEIDVACNVLSGTVFFLNPLKDRRIVELEYTLADDLGEKLLDEETKLPTEIKEFLPLYVRSETATFVETNEFSFNLAESDGFQRTLFSAIPPRVVVDGFQCNYGVEDCVIKGNTIYLSLGTDVGTGNTVTVSYAVLETYGGEQVYNSSQRPMYRPSFYIEQEKDNFILETDRTSDLQVGMLFRLGADSFYIKSATYDSNADETTVTIFPPTIREVGSRSPNNDVLTLLSSEPITPSVDPNNPISTTARLGFLLPITNPLFTDTVIEWKAVNRGQNKIEFLTDLTKYAVAGHILEIGGTPFTIAQSNLSEDGLKTIVELTSVFPQGYSIADSLISLSVRPVYPPFSQAFVGLGGLVENLPSSLIMFGEVDENGTEKAGRELVRSVHYEINTATGDLVLLQPLQAPLLSKQVLYLNHTQVTELSPFFDPSSQVLITPKYFVKSKVVATPNDENLLLGATIQTTNTFYSPDTFYNRITPLLAFSGETVQRLSSFNSSNPQGPISSVSDDPQSFDKGVSSLETQRSNLTDDDRSAKLYLEFYNVAVTAFEQVSETITGEVIGDRDGKFRFFIGRQKENAPSGYECPITGILNPINIWGKVFESESGFAFVDNDDLLDPRTATLVSAEIDGDNLDQETFEMLATRQKMMVKNDIDDVVLTSRGRWNFQWFEITRKGVFEDLSVPSDYSRLFPEQVKTFLLTYPGLQYDLSKRTTATSREEWSGWYSFSRVLEKATFSWDKGISPTVRGSTRNKEIGVISNPAIGKIDNIQDVVLGRRYPRARVFGYYPTGISANALGTGFPSSDISKPCVLATPLELSKFPVDPTTGLPNLAQLTANGGELIDLSTGDPNLRTPPMTDFELSKQVAFGFPNGESITPVSADEPQGGVYADEILYGCLITFSGGASADTLSEITSSDQIVNVDENGDPSTEIELVRGDTIYFVAPFSSIDFDTISDPLTQEDMRKLSKVADNYDVFVDRKKGVLLDRTFLNHTEEDGVFSGPWFSQNPPLPLSELEGSVSFSYGDMSFFEFPALRGEGKDDDGDYSIPYLKTSATERDRFGEITRITSELLSLISPNGFYVYADEIRDDDGEILPSLTGTKPPSALVTSKRHNPHSFLNTALGKNDTEQFDLLLMEYLSNATLPQSSQGILSVGRVYRDQVETLDGSGGGTVSDFSVIEPPRFITPTGKGSAHRYNLENAMVHIHDSTEWDWTTGEPPTGIHTSLNTSGLVIHEDNDPVSPKIVLDFSSLGQIELADGTGNGTGNADPADPLTWGGDGGFNRLLNGGANTIDNEIKIKIFAREKTTSGAVTRDANGGDLLLIIAISNNGQQVRFTYTDNNFSSTNLASTIFGKYDPLQQSGDLGDFKCITLEMLAPNMLNLPTHTEIPNTTVGTVSTTDYAFDFSISVDTANTIAVTQGSMTARIETDRLTFSECYDLRYARPREFRHPVGKQYLQTLLMINSVDTEDFNSVTQSIDVADTVLLLTFLVRDNDHLDPIPSITDTHYNVGTFVNASVNDQGDESSTIRAMGFEGVGTFVDLTINPPTVSVTVEDLDDTGDTVINRFGVITRVEVTDIGGAVGLQGTLTVIITGAGYGAQISIDLDSNGDLPLGDLNILNGGRGYVAPTITFYHYPNDVPVIAEDITFALVPSSVEDESGVIATGSARLLHSGEDTVIESPQVAFGTLDNVEKGDIIVVNGSTKTSTYTYGDGTSDTFNHATNVCGTYVVRQALENTLFGGGHITTDLGSTGNRVQKSATLPNQTSWVSGFFPTVTSINSAQNKLTLDRDVSYADSPSGHYYGKKYIISHLVITGTTGVPDFTKEDIGRQFTVGADCIVEIVDVDQSSGTVTELSIIDRGNSFFAPTTNWSITSLATGSTCDGVAHSVQESKIFLLLNSAGLDTVALSCPFTVINNLGDSAEITVDISSIGTVGSKVYYGNVIIDNALLGTVFTLLDGTTRVLLNVSDCVDFFWEQALKSKVGGHKYLPINLRRNTNEDRYVGKRYVTDSGGILHHISSYGFLALTLRNATNSSTVVEKDFVSYHTRGTGIKTDLVSERFGANEIGIVSKTKVSSNVFVADKDSIIFDDVPTMLDLQSISDLPTDTGLPFYSLHPNAQCLVMGDRLSTECLNYSDPSIVTGVTSLFGDMVEDGFIAKDGIYTEPSFPKSAQNYIGGNQRVVEDTSPAVLVSEIGYRRSTYDEQINFSVKRIRRFHEIQTELQGSIQPLRYAYEIRRGVPTDYTVDNKGVGVLSAEDFVFQAEHPSFENPTKTYKGTQLGGFNAEDVNIESGDMVRLIHNGVVVETAEILRVGERVGSTTGDKSKKLSLRAPGFTNSDFQSAVTLSDFTNWSFEVFLRNAIIPHEQSNEELLSLITQQVILETRANPTSQLGGYVPHIPLLSQTLDGLGEISTETGNPKTWTEYINRLYDDLNAPNPSDYLTLGVQVGDIVIVDKQGVLKGATGSLPIAEKGSRPFGDFGIIDREDGGANSVIGRNAYEIGATSPLDDNRGFYKVVEIKEDHLVLQSGYKNEFVGTYGVDKTFPEDVSLKSKLGYSIYPTVHNSNLHNSNFFAVSSDDEGQMDLRPTQYAGFKNDGTLHPDSDKHNSFSVSDFSIRPFSYKIIRPSSLFTEETIEFVLMVRERMSSLIEHFRSFMILEKSGDYYDFQDNQHIEDIGTSTIAETGLGIYHNAYLEDILGRMDLAPFGNDSDCLSLLDRRFIIQDSSLDTLCPDSTGVGSGLVSSLGGIPYTAYEDTSGFYGGADGSLVRPLLVDHIGIILDDRDRFRDLRSTWIEYRTHRTEGLLAQLRQFDSRIAKNIADQQNYYLRLKSQK